MTTKESKALAGILEGYRQDIRKRDDLIKTASTDRYKEDLARENLVLSQVINRLERFERSGT